MVLIPGTRVDSMAAPRPLVSKEVFLDAALKIADEFGPDALTTRSLGNAVGLDSTTVYRYFGSKDLLLGTLFDYVVGKVLARCEHATGTPQERIRNAIAAYLDVFTEHPNVARLNSRMADMLDAGHGTAPNSARITALVLGFLREMGLSGRQLMFGYQLIETFVVGAVLYESGARARGMSVRVLRFNALGDGSLDGVAVGIDEVMAISAEVFWLGVDRLIAELEGMASQA